MLRVFGCRVFCEIFRQFLRVSDFSQSILTFRSDFQNAPFPPPSYRDLAEFRSCFRDRRNPTSRSRFAVLVRVFGSRSFCEIRRQFFADFGFFEKRHNVSFGFPKCAFPTSELPGFGPLSAAFLRSPKSEPSRRFVARFRQPFFFRDISPIFCGFRISRKTS